MTEVNPFQYYLPPKAQKLILGSFPCYNGRDYGNFFYSGSGRNFFWPLLASLAGLPASSVEEKKALCDKFGLALSDIALRVTRSKNNCSDSNLRILEYNKEGINRCLSQGVSRVFFTSRFVQDHFYRLFPDNAINNTLLPSPSPAANRHIGGLKEYLEGLRTGRWLNVYDYRLSKYREALFS